MHTLLRFAVMISLLALVASAWPQAPTTYANPQEALDAARGMVNQAQAIQDALAANNTAYLQSLGLSNQQQSLERASQIRRQALQLFQQNGDDESASIELSALAEISRQLGLFDLALSDLRQAAVLDHAMDNTEWVLFDLTGLINLYDLRGFQWERMLALRESARLAAQRGDRQRAALDLRELADISANAGNWRACAEDAEQAVDLVRPLGQPNLLAWHLNLYGEALRHQGQVANAQMALEEARETATENETRANAIGELGHVAFARGDAEGAMNNWREAISILEPMGGATRLREFQESLIQAALDNGRAQEAVSVSGRRLADSQRLNPAGSAFVANALAAHGEVQLRAGDPTGAGNTLNQALAIYTQLNSREGQALTRLNLAEAALALNDPNTALTDINPVNPGLFRDTEVQRRAALLTARAHRQLGSPTVAHQHLMEALRQAEISGDLEGRVEALEEAAGLWRDSQNESRLSGALSNLAVTLKELGKRDEACEVYEELMQVFEVTQQNDDWSMALTNFALLKEEMGDLPRAVELVEQATELDRQRPTPDWILVDLRDLARLRAAVGDAEGARAAAEEILVIGQQAANPTMQVEAHEILARHYQEADDLDAARQSLEQAEAIARQANDMMSLSRVLSSMGEIAAKQDDWAELQRRAQEALGVDQQLNNANYQALDHLNLCVALARQGRWAEARSHAEQVLSLLGNNQRDYLCVMAMLNRGSIDIQSGQASGVIADYQRLVPSLRDMGRRDIAATVLHAVAVTQRDSGQADLAVDTYREAIGLSEEARLDDPPSPALCLLELTPREQLYSEVIDLLRAEGRDFEALEYRLNQDQFDSEFQDFLTSQAATPEQTATTVVEAPTPTEPVATPTEPVEQPTRMSDLLVSRPSLEDTERERSRADWLDHYATMSSSTREGMDLGLSVVNRLLDDLPDDQTLFVMYVLGDPCIAVYGSLDTNLNIVELDVDEETVTEMTTGFRGLVRQANDYLDRAQRGEMTTEAYDALAPQLETDANTALLNLYRALVQRLEMNVPNFDSYHTVLIHPPKELRPIPFGALINPATNQHWIETHNIVYSPTRDNILDLIDSLEEPVRRLRGDMLMVAWPGSDRNFIENVLQEEEMIHRLWSEGRGEDQYHSLVRDDASVENLEASLTRFTDLRILHFATHGMVRTDPNQSYIEMANRERLNNRMLTQLPLHRTHLTILSMCDAEYSPDHPGDPLGTLARTIYNAGCPSVIATLWRVRDASALQVMTHFYQNVLTDSMGRGEALAEAQRALIATRGEETDLSHPFNWAPFVLIGEWR